MRHLTSTVLGSALIATSPVLAMGLNEVPAPVVAIAQQAVPGVEWSGAQVDVEYDTLKATYEVQGKKDGKSVEVDITPDGELREVELQIDAAAVPAEVKKLLDAYLPGFQPSMVEHSQRPTGPDFYEFSGTHQGREIDVEVSESGTIITINDDAAA